MVIWQQLNVKRVNFIREGKDVTDDVVGFTLKSNFGVSIGLGEPIKYNLK